MKRTAIILLAVSVFVLNFGFIVYAEDLVSQISSLQQKAERVEAQINQAKQQSEAAMDQQIKSLMGQADNLIKQRVQMDSQISKIDAQIDEIKNSAKANLNRQVKSYDQELINLKQQMASLNAKKWAEEAQKMKDEEAKNQAQKNPTEPIQLPAPGQPAQK
jgi:phage-related minor tail protein